MHEKHYFVWTPRFNCGVTVFGKGSLLLPFLKKTVLFIVGWLPSDAKQLLFKKLTIHQPSVDAGGF